MPWHGHASMAAPFLRACTPGVRACVYLLQLNLFGALVSVYIQGGLSFKVSYMPSPSGPIGCGSRAVSPVPLPLQAVYNLLGGTKMTLTEFIAILGGASMLFTQLPTLHSLW